MGKWPSTSREERSHQKSNSQAPRSSTSRLQNYEKTNVCCSGHSVWNFVKSAQADCHIQGHTLTHKHTQTDGDVTTDVSPQPCSSLLTHPGTQGHTLTLLNQGCTSPDWPPSPTGLLSDGPADLGRVDGDAGVGYRNINL